MAQEFGRAPFPVRRFIWSWILASLLSYAGLVIGTKWYAEADTARHEAGHAVAYYAIFGAVPLEMALTTFDLGSRQGYTTFCDGDCRHAADDAADAWYALVMNLAGMAAAGSEEGGSGDIADSLPVIVALLRAQETGRPILPPWPAALPQRKLTADDIVREARRYAAELVAAHGPQVDALAAALLRRGRLERAEIGAILADAGE